MTGISIEEVESKVINTFLDILRNGLVDIKTPSRNTKYWIRSQVKVSESTLGLNKRTRVKSSSTPGFPQVVVCDFFETRELRTMKSDNYQCKFKTYYVLTIRILDKGSSAQTGKLAGSVQKVLFNNINTLQDNYIYDLSFSNVPLPGYSTDNMDLNERQIICKFKVAINYASI